MPAGLRITLAEPEASPTEFGADVAEIYIGRDQRTCQFVIPPDRLHVSGEHCSLVRVPGGYRLRLNRGNIVLVDGERAHDDQDLGVLHELTLGRGGPRLVVESLGDAGVKPTRKREGREPSPHSAIRSAENRLTSRARRSILIGAGLLAVLAIGGTAGFQIANGRAVRAASTAQAATHGLQDLTVDMLREREESRARFQPVVQRIRASVYLVAKRLDPHERGALHPFGTAWVAAPGSLATNAHVAEEFKNLQPGESLVAVGPDGTELRIRGTRVHPGYARFAEVVASHRVIDAPAGRWLSGSVPAACDVALLDVVPEDAAGLGPPLETATREELAQLEPGVSLGFVGYPQEGLVKGGVSLRRPQATFQEGILTGKTGFFLDRTDSDQDYLVHFSMAVAGGASGSPVFTRTGKVIAILCAGNFAHIKDQPRVPIGGVNYGQRIDLLRELQENSTPEQVLAHHEAEWNAELDKLFELGTGGFLMAIERMVSSQAGAALVQVLNTNGTIAKAGLPSAAHVRVATADLGTYVLVLVGDRNLPIRAHVLHGKTVIAEGQPVTLETEEVPYLTIAQFSARAGDEFDVLVSLEADDQSHDVPFRIRVSRLDL